MEINERQLVTKFVHPHVRMDTEYGLVSGETWLKKEKVRVGGCGIVRDEKGLMALRRNEPGPEKKYEEQLKSVKWVKKFGKSR
ncbi:hypothetical protein CCP3SC15_150025 [Gammaproteobacteria bacterium]